MATDDSRREDSAGQSGDGRRPRDRPPRSREQGGRQRRGPGPASGSGGERVDTDATTAGLLPDGPGVALLALVTVGVLALGTVLGYSTGALAVLCGAGVLGALGVRTATGPGRGATGVALVWVAAFAFAATAAVVMGESGQGLASLLAGLAVASGALLAPFAVLGSTVRLYGHGAGRRVVRRYLLGTLLLGGVAVAVLAGTRVLSLGWDLLPPALTYSLVSGSLVRRVLVAMVVYGAALVVGVRAARAVPVAVFVEPSEFDRVWRTRGVIERAYYYGLRALGLYVVVAQILLLLVAGSESDGEALRTVVGATAPPLVVTAVGTVTAVLAGVLVVLWVLRSVGGLSRSAVAEVIVPPIAVATLAVAVVTSAPERVGTTLDGPVEPAVFEAFLTDVSPGALVGLLAVLFLASAVVFTVPTLVAGQGLGDESLAGIASATLGVVVLVVVAIAAGRGLVVVAGVALAAVVWEFGEFVTVASGELATPSTGLPDGFGRLASVHAVATLAVTAGAVALGALVFVVATGTALSTAVGAVALVVTGLGIAALTLLLNG
jgi:hypothetical protein